MKIHILEKTNNSYRVVIHFAVPIKTTLAKISLKDAIKLKGENSSALSIAKGQITQIEHDQIVSGDIIEIVKSISGADTDEAITQLVDIAIKEHKAKLSSEYKLYGYTIK